MGDSVQLTAQLSNLEEEAERLYPKLVFLHHRWKQGQISDAECAILYFLTFIIGREGSSTFQWHKKKQFLTQEKPTQDPHSQHFYSLFHLAQEWPEFALYFLDDRWKTVPLHKLFDSLSFKSLPKAALDTLTFWAKGDWSCVLATRVLRPLEVLHLQAQGKRCVGLFFEKKELSQLILGEKSPFDFFLHDLIHAERFFARQGDFLGQKGFYHLMEQSYQDAFRPLMVKDPFFQEKLEYLISDMNTYCGHQFFYLKAILIEYFLRYFGKMKHESLNTEEKSFFDDFFSTLMKQWKVPSHVQGAMMRANTIHFTPSSDLICIQRFFESASAFADNEFSC
jgi:hypothetical protein